MGLANASRFSRYGDSVLTWIWRVCHLPGSRQHEPLDPHVPLGRWGSQWMWTHRGPASQLRNSHLWKSPAFCRKVKVVQSCLTFCECLSIWIWEERAWNDFAMLWRNEKGSVCSNRNPGTKTMMWNYMVGPKSSLPWLAQSPVIYISGGNEKGFYVS